jgi:hypothetical protein
MKPILVVLALAVSSVIACGDNAYYCLECGGDSDLNAEITQRLANKLGLGTCMCWGSLITYADLEGQDMEKVLQFIDGCRRMRCRGWRRC